MAKKEIPKRIKKAEFEAIYKALKQRAHTLWWDVFKGDYQKAGFGPASFFWGCQNYDMVERVKECFHFKSDPCVWARLSKNQECICICHTKDDKFYLHTHLTGQCPWRIYDEYS